MFFAKLTALALLGLLGLTHHHSPIDNFGAHSPIHVRAHSNVAPTGLSPAQIKAAYNLPSDGGSGKTIAIVDAYDSPTIASDLNTFSTKFGLPICNTSNPCFEKQTISRRTSSNSGWALEEALDVEWAHAIAPSAKILLVEARSASGNDLLAAVDYARNRSDVVAVSMSWGGGEFSGESSYDSHFTSGHGVQFFSSSGDSGSGVSWPAVSPNVIGVGGTTLTLASNGTVTNETAWSGSGGGVSQFVTEPSYQSSLVTLSGGHRATPDVSYDADPATGYAVYDTTRYAGQSGWFQVGGTSAGSPQWAAIHALGSSISSQTLYTDASGPHYSSDFRDILSGTNGNCGTRCTAGPGYDTVTGLGSPLTTAF
jgi:subtilase family serine protease